MKSTAGYTVDHSLYNEQLALVDWLIDWLIDWLNDWLIDWLIDWSYLVKNTVRTCQKNTHNNMRKDNEIR